MWAGAGRSGSPIKGSQPASTQGGYKGVAFSRSTTGDSAFVSVTVTFPRSCKPVGIKLTVSAGASALQIQGFGPEFWSDQVGPNLPTFLDLSAYPEATSIVVQTKGFGTLKISGSVFYN